MHWFYETSDQASKFCQLLESLNYWSPNYRSTTASTPTLVKFWVIIGHKYRGEVHFFLERGVKTASCIMHRSVIFVEKYSTFNLKPVNIQLSKG